MERCRRGVGRLAAARRRVLRARQRCVGQQGTVIHGRSSDHGRVAAEEERRVVDTGGGGSESRRPVVNSASSRVFPRDPDPDPAAAR